MKDRKLATRYARALLSLLSDPQEAEQADRFLGELRRAVERSDELRAVLVDPAVSRKARKGILHALCEQHGTVMKEYVAVPDRLLKKTQELKKYFAISYAYVGSLKPKATTRKASKKTSAGKKAVKKTRRAKKK